VWISASADANGCVKTAHRQPGVGQPRRVVHVAAQIILSGAALAARVDARLSPNKADTCALTADQAGSLSVI
jgi:hypothetical protein